jgi:glycosyltransferase involved in cell wall biosynthesis
MVLTDRGGMNSKQESLRVALIHDYWVQIRGGERAFLAFTRMFPQADCYALVRGHDDLAPFPTDRKLRTSLVQHVPFAADHPRAMLPLYPLAARALDLRAYDLVLSSSSGFCHAARITGVHVCYCHSPFRYAWQEYDATLDEQRNPLVRGALALVLNGIRRSDYAAAQRVTMYAANSRITQQRIKEYYGRESVVVGGYIDTKRFVPATQSKANGGFTDGSDGYYLTVSHLLPYKRVDLAVEACTRLGKRLVVVGQGPEQAKLQRLAGPSVTFYSHVDEARLAELYAGCGALLQCNVEDFGLIALEVQASGRPVLAYGVGGALDTVVPDATGAFFAEQSADALTDALASFDPTAYDPRVIRAHAEQFNEAHFTARVWQVIKRAFELHGAPTPVSPSLPFR